jgi:hypothetical protein
MQIYEVDANSNNYYPVVDVANQDNDHGFIRIAEPFTESGVADDFGIAWCEFVVSSVAAS